MSSAGYWPEAPERIARMFESIEIIAQAVGSRGKDVKHKGKYYSWRRPGSGRCPRAAADLHRDRRAGHGQEGGAATPTG